mgnify:FL=1|tara:strand:- start:3339 stop:3524 length:186 start_codon:yes stop_codon:yes gene_type:complete
MNAKEPNINKEPRNKTLCAPSIFLNPDQKECDIHPAEKENNKQQNNKTSVSEYWRYHVSCM